MFQYQIKLPGETLHLEDWKPWNKNRAPRLHEMASLMIDHANRNNIPAGTKLIFYVWRPDAERHANGNPKHVNAVLATMRGKNMDFTPVN